VLSGVVGVTVFLSVVLATAAEPPKIAAYFTQEATTVDEAGGHNIVNVVLVDYRALDTLGEISVVAMAAISVVTLIAMRQRGESS
jgi:multicomponent Na+:H+ antiporter subunit A